MIVKVTTQIWHESKGHAFIAASHTDTMEHEESYDETNGLVLISNEPNYIVYQSPNHEMKGHLCTYKKVIITF